MINRNKFKAFVALFLSLTALVAVGCGSDDDGGETASGGGEGTTLKVGYVSALTGWLAEFEDTFTNALKLEIDEVNAAGGLDGQYPVELTVVDGKSDPAEGALAAEQLTSDGNTLLFGPCDQDAALPAAQVAAEKGVPFISSCAGASEFTDIVNPYVYLSVPGTWADGSGMAEWALDKGYDSAYMLWSKDIAYLQSVGEAFEAQYTAGGGELLGSSEYKMGEPRYTTEIDKIANLDPQPEFIAGVAITPDSIVMLRELATRNIDIPVMFPYGNQTDLILQPKEALAKLDAYVLGLSPVPEDGSDIAKFFKAYEDKYGEAPSPSQAAMAADDVAVLEDVMARAGSTDSEAIQLALQEVEGVEGITGPVTYKGQNGRPEKDYTVVKLTPEGFEFEESFFPEDVYTGN